MFEYHPEPKGCQWFRTCEVCKFADCKINLGEKWLSYDSPQAYRIRVRRAKHLAAKGVNLPDIAEYFGVTETDVKAWTKANVRQAVLEISEAVIRERKDGAHEKELAEKYGVSNRTIRRICIGLSKRQRASRNSIGVRQGQEAKPWAGGAIRAGYTAMGCSKAMLNTLTPQERQTFRLIGLGKSDREIAIELDISVGTTQHRIGAIRRKLNLGWLSRIELFPLASVVGVISPKAVHMEMDRRLRVRRKAIRHVSPD